MENGFIWVRILPVAGSCGHCSQL